MAKTNTIQKIEVLGLFGLYNYEIPLEKKRSFNQVLILYGDNGSGKTTILRLIFHLLASETSEGHKTFLAKTKFKKITINFSNGAIVEASRDNSVLLGSFDMRLRNEKGKTVRTSFIADSDYVVRGGTSKDKENDAFLKALEEMKLTLYLLGDDRTARVTSPTRFPKLVYRKSPGSKGVIISGWEQIGLSPEQSPDPELISRALLGESMGRLRRYIQNQMMRGSTRGESDVNTIFSSIIEKIAGASPKKSSRKFTRRDQLIDRVEEVESRNNSFFKYGLTPSFNGQKILESVEKASKSRFQSVRQIIVPYLDSFEAKLDALSHAQECIESFVNTINSYMVDKKVLFNIRKGFRIIAKNKEELDLDMLSSGERHLLLLFSNALTALEYPSIFIIDEPEISLNVKWQRKLINSLMECAKERPVQYVFATHSMEILSQHMDKVVKLESRND